MGSIREELFRRYLSTEMGTILLLNSSIQPLRARLSLRYPEVNASQYRVKPSYFVFKELEGLTLDEKVVKFMEWLDAPPEPTFHPLLIHELEWASSILGSEEAWNFCSQHKENYLQFLTREEVCGQTNPEQTLLDLIKSQREVNHAAG